MKFLCVCVCVLFYLFWGFGAAHGLSLVAVNRLLTVEVSLVAEQQVVLLKQVSLVSLVAVSRLLTVEDSLVGSGTHGLQ